MRAGRRWLTSVWPVAVAAAFFGVLHLGSQRPVAHASESVSRPLPALRESRGRWFTLHSDAPPSQAAVVLSALDDAADAFLRVSADLGATRRPAPGSLRCVFFTEHADFLRFAREHDSTDASWMGGYYSAAHGRVVAYDDATGVEFGRAMAACVGEDAESRDRRARVTTEAAIATREKLTHEAAHLMAFATGVQKPGVHYPDWVTEGLAESFARGALNARAFAPDAWSVERPVGQRAAQADAPGATSHPGSRYDAGPIDEFYDRSLSLVDLVCESRPGALAALLRAIERAPDAVGARAVADQIAAAAGAQAGAALATADAPIE